MGRSYVAKPDSTGWSYILEFDWSDGGSVHVNESVLGAFNATVSPYTLGMIRWNYPDFSPEGWNNTVYAGGEDHVSVLGANPGGVILHSTAIVGGDKVNVYVQVGYYSDSGITVNATFKTYYLGVLQETYNVTRTSAADTLKTYWLYFLASTGEVTIINP